MANEVQTCSNLSEMKTEIPLNEIIQGDCVEVMNSLPAGIADVIFADPPYNLQLKNSLFRPDSSEVDAVNDEWDKFDSMTDYCEFTRIWLTAAKRILKPNGTIWVIGSYHNIFHVGHAMRELGFWFLNDVVWNKSNPMPNFNGTRFTNATETMIWAKSSEKQKKYTFNYQEMKSYNDDKQMTNVWNIPLCTGNERLKVDGQKAHSTQKPSELLDRVIRSSTNRGDLVLDPFLGSGTTAAVAKKLGRNYIGVERDQGYVDLAVARINDVQPELFFEEIPSIDNRRTRPKVPFGQLVAQNILKVGSEIVSKDKKHRATICGGGRIRCGEFEGSIHKVSAKIEERTSMNGWDYWFVDGPNFESIDKLRVDFIEQGLNS